MEAVHILERQVHELKEHLHIKDDKIHHLESHVRSLENEKHAYIMKQDNFTHDAVEFRELKIKYEHIRKELTFLRDNSDTEDHLRHFKRQAIEWEHKYFKRIDTYTELQYDYEQS
jgi:predicted RNase H-like nuclease (RuvC/YqgF family)